MRYWLVQNDWDHRESVFIGVGKASLWKICHIASIVSDELLDTFFQHIRRDNVWRN